ncbi:hypothetical protein [Mesorhizobium sp. BH1-1-4]|uniref:hypothetical protein n=1 Tax=Mesorhizobium sp. BH1-1-4 TaxID=2876662 RepID=UPI001CD08AEF|nr:hypothetical protein [Mesorhizobium sp. BH1-1-4]MBZ9994094.1 hypothetical protein [Mesorhizobium sp. BH1-1-4]
MTDSPYDGFRFEHSRPDMGMPNGVLKVHIIAVARSLDEAEALAGDILPEQGLRLIAEGPDVLKAARLVHLKDGEAKVL